MKQLFIRPCTLAEANRLVAALHRHHKPCVGHRFSIKCLCQDGALHGCAIVGRPVAREVPQYATAEVLRLVTDGTGNACSYLYGAAARVAREMGFLSIQTYILDAEPGTSLRAAGWMLTGTTAGGNWNHSRRKGRREDQPMSAKQRWVKQLSAPTLFDLADPAVMRLHNPELYEALYR